jgi:hypothetical protein
LTVGRHGGGGRKLKISEATRKLRIGESIATMPAKRLALWASAVCGVLFLIVAVSVVGWSHSRFNRVSICTSCHEIFVDIAEYQPTDLLRRSIPGASM